MNYSRYVFLIIALLLWGCRSPETSQDSAAAPAAQAYSNYNSVNRNGLAIRTELEGTPVVGDVMFSVYLLENNQALSGADVRINGDMTHAGMAPVIVDAPEIGSGLYQSQGFRFTMAGDWLITTTVTLPDGRREETEFLLNVPR